MTASFKGNKEPTPMMRQWLDAKAKAKDAVLLFRMGDFYELFAEDALVAGELLGLAVTTRDRSKGDDAMPMAGFPHPQAPAYIARLIGMGLKVAVCDQLEDPALARGIVKRDVTRIVTPGSVLDDESLDARANNFLVAVTAPSSGVLEGFGLCALDVSTGELLTTTLAERGALMDELARLLPRELVVEDTLDAALAEHIAKELGALREGVRVNARPGTRDDTRLVDVVARSRAGQGLDPWLAAHASALRACQLALQYVQETGQGTLPSHLLPPRPYAVAEQLLLDPVTRAHLEITGPAGDLRKSGTLLGTIDITKTAAGGRHLLRRLTAPSADLAVIEAHLDRTAALVADPGLRARVREDLHGLPDIERIVARCAVHGFRGKVFPRDLSRLRQALRTLPSLASAFACVPAGGELASADVAAAAALCALLEQALVAEPALSLGAGPVIARGFDGALDDLDVLAATGRDRIAALEDDEKKATGIASLKVRYTSVFGYYIEVTRTHLQKVPAHYQRKQTVSNGERYVTEALSALEEQVVGAQARHAARETGLFDDVVSRVSQQSAPLLALAARIAELDATAALAELAATERWCRPHLLERAQRRLAVVDARHAVVERAVQQRGEVFVPSSLTLDGARQVILVTGPNMAGKSTMMRQVALMQILAQAGSFVPARSAELSICDRIFTRVGASDDLSKGRSTFMVEMTETSHILRAATPHSLVLLDEIGRGTSTYDGLSIAWAVAEHIHDVTGSRTLFATHYHELAQLCEHLPRLHNVHVVVSEQGGEIVFVRTLAEGPAAHSYGIQVARLAGLPASVVQRAREVLLSLEGNGAVLASSARLPRQHSHEGEPSRSIPAAQPDAGAHALLIERLRAFDVLRMTPLQAMSELSALVDEARKA